MRRDNSDFIDTLLDEYFNPPASNQPAPVPGPVTANPPASVESNSPSRVSEPVAQNNILDQLLPGMPDPNNKKRFLINSIEMSDSTDDSTDELFLEAAEQQLNRVLESANQGNDAVDNESLLMTLKVLLRLHSLRHKKTK